jgi:hypothetical protein
LIIVACGSSAERAESPIAETLPSSTPSLGDRGADCDGPKCQRVACPGGEQTTVSGTVFAPNGQIPIYNAIVYVPNEKPGAIVKGASCDPCGSVTGKPVVAALSGPDGRFTLKDVPTGKDVPLVIQLGKWRRQVVLSEVKACEDNKLEGSELTRFPRNQQEGDIPRIAITTGGCDKLGCILPKLGLDASEFGVAQDGRAKSVHLYNGEGGSGPLMAEPASRLWDDITRLKQYDMTILSCECSEAPNTKPPTSFAAITDYMKAGGRIFTTDFMYTWYRNTPDPKLRAATNIRGGAPGVSNPIEIDTSFPKGRALGEWLEALDLGASHRISADTVYGNIISVDPALATTWATSNGGFVERGPRVFSVNMPLDVPAEKQCGKGVHIDAHVNTNADTIDARYPGGCNSPMKEGEQLLTFFFFDLASCIQIETTTPAPPVVVK